MRPVLMASFALFTALTSCPFLDQLWAQPAFALDDSCASAKANGSHQFTGMADYYHHSLYGKRTASGQVLAKHLYTAAHRTLPFGTHVHVKNHTNGRSCVVVINDRGPFTKSKVIDLSHSAATELDMISAGTCKVGCTVVPKPKNIAAKPEAVKIAALVKPVKAKPTAPAVSEVSNTAPVSKELSRADENSAELEGAVPVKWTEIQ